MRDIENRLRELGDRVERWNPSRSLPHSTRSKIKRHRKANALAGGLLASALVLGVTNLVPTSPRTVSPAGDPSVATETREVPTPGDREPGPSGERIARDEFWGAVWPEDDRSETEHGCSEEASQEDPFRASAMDTAVQFGRAVLGWDAAEGIARGTHRNSIQIELTRGDGASAVDLSMVEYVDGCWSVQSVTPAEEVIPIMWDRTVKGDGQTNVLSVAFDPPADTAGRVEMAYGDQLQTRRFTAGDVSMDHPLVFNFGAIGPFDAGHALILFEDRDGDVTSAFAAALNPQKGGARADGLP